MHHARDSGADEAVRDDRDSAARERFAVDEGFLTSKVPDLAAGRPPAIMSNRINAR